jgi:N-methylhydantoinase A
MGDILRECNIDATLSSEVSPKFREYERVSTTVASAYVRPLVVRHLERLESSLAQSGLRSRLAIMQSNGGIISSDLARRHPIRVIESGPAAGVLMCAEIGRQLGCDHVPSPTWAARPPLGTVDNGERDRYRYL